MGVNTHFLWICLVGMLDEMAIREKLATILDVCFVFHFGQLFLQILVTLTRAFIRGEGSFTKQKTKKLLYMCFHIPKILQILKRLPTRSFHQA